MNRANALANGIYRSLAPTLFRLDPETVHDWSIQRLAQVSGDPVLLSVVGRVAPEPSPRLQVRIFDRTLALPVVVAAGFDKNAVTFPALLALGFGGVETGTVTPLPQAGNPKPRVFRLPEDRALINRMGFPNLGVETVVNNLVRLRRPDALVGCNIGPNKASVEGGTAVDDFIAAWRRVVSYCAYVALNVSSPNTPGLRTHQRADHLESILSPLRAERMKRQRRPLVIKLSPDLDLSDLEAIVDVAIRYGVDGIVATNTTIDRPPTLRSSSAAESGGLSGRPLAAKSAQTVRHLVRLADGRASIIAAGGIESGRDVLTAISCGAAFVQVYTGFIYRGPAMPGLIQQEMLDLMDRHGIRDLAELRCSGYRF